MGFDDYWQEVEMDPHTNIFAMNAIFKANLDYYKGNVLKALAGYNAGPTSVNNGIAEYESHIKYLKNLAAKTGNVQDLRYLREQENSDRWIYHLKKKDPKTGKWIRIESTIPYVRRIIQGTEYSLPPRELNLPSKQKSSKFAAKKQ
jgi:hypothetical protein